MKLNEYWSNLGLLLFFMLLCGLYALQHGQDNNYDFLNYHYYNGYALIHHRLNYDIAPAGMGAYFNPLLDAFNYLVISSIQNPKLIAFILGSISGISTFFLYKTARLLFQNYPSHNKTVYWLMALLLGVTAGSAQGQIGSTMNDAQVAVLVAIGIFFAIKALISENVKPSHLFFGAVFCGMATGCKFTAGTYSLSYVIAVILLPGSLKQRLQWLALTGFGNLLGFLITDGFWAYQMYVHFQSPIYPFFNAIFRSPYYPAVNITDPNFGVHGLVAALFSPFIMFKVNVQYTEPLMRDWRMPVAFIFIYLALLTSLIAILRKKQTLKAVILTISPAWRFILVFFIVSYFVWVMKFGIFRYSIPTQYVTGFVIVYLFDRLVRHEKAKRLYLVLLTVLIMATTIHPNFGHWDWKEYKDKFVAVYHLPSIPDDSMVFLGNGGEDYVIPFFPPKVRFVSLNFSAQANSLSSEAIFAHTGAFYVLYYQVPNGLTAALDYYHLVQSGQCETFSTNAQTPRNLFYLCPLVRTTSLGV